YVTTPIFYVNAAPHFGHLFSSVVADVYARYYKLKGRDVLFATGTDEHGQKIQEAAAKSGKTPQDFCDEVSVKFKNLDRAADVGYSDFIRTTEARHKAAATAIWNELFRRGHIYKGFHEGWYAVSDETFYPANAIVEIQDPKSGEAYKVSKESGSRVEWMKEENYKFRLSSFVEPLITWLEANPDAVVPAFRHREVLNMLRSQSEIGDLSVSRLRSRLSWGIPVPNDADHVMYVWLDALTNYLTVAGYPSTEDGKPFWPADIHVIGQDIVRFHAIFWPAFLMAAGLPLPKQILVHAHWTVDGGKMSKSKGNVVDPFELIQRYGVDPVRYYLIRDGSVSHDSEFSQTALQARYNSDLLNQLGNLLQRCTSASINPSGLVPVKLDGDARRVGALQETIGSLAERFDAAVSRRDLTGALDLAASAIGDLNKFFTDSKPWTLKKPENAADLRTILYYTYEGLRIVAILLQPVMPRTTKEVLDRLAVPASERSFCNARLGGRY
ncbi:tRNA synthetases class I (M)-domain-containing protein, partial [Hyaloraphidium curvatum]